MVNKVILIGFLGEDPKEVNSGAKFSLATSETYKKDGEYITNTEWHSCIIFGKQSDFVTKYLKKGDNVYVEGKITYSSYERDGETKYYTNINVNKIQKLGKKSSDDDYNKADSKPKKENNAEEDDDLPF